MFADLSYVGFGALSAYGGIITVFLLKKVMVHRCSAQYKSWLTNDYYNKMEVALNLLLSPIVFFIYRILIVEGSDVVFIGRFLLASIIITSCGYYMYKSKFNQ